MLAAPLVLAACSGGVSLDAPALSRADARACSALVAALPVRVADQPRRKVDAATYGAAWGDPAIELRCGVPRPQGFNRFSSCLTANGVDWFIPRSQQTGRPQVITMTTVGRSQNVEVRLPAAYLPVNTMVDLAPAVKRKLPRVRPCV